MATLFLLSGCTSLVYQVVWVRMLTLTFGASTFAVAAVLMAFMGGMSGGAFLAGKIADRRGDQIRLYAVLEIAIGLYALVFPYLLEVTGNLYVVICQHYSLGFYGLTLIRLAGSLLMLLIPTLAMGATLPLLCSQLAGDKRNGPRRTALLYGVNTFGAFLGCVGAGFFLIPLLGLDGMTHVAVAVNIGIGFAGILLNRHIAVKRSASSLQVEAHEKESRVQKAPAPSPESAELISTATILVVALCGFTGMAYETLWTRVLTMIIGSTVHAFSTMLAAFLLGIVLGSLIYAMIPIRRATLTLACCQLVIGLFVLFALPHWDELPFAFLKVFTWSNGNWTSFQVFRFLMLMAVLIVPTTLLGLSFPLAVRIVVRTAGETGKHVGVLYGFNTIGAILGSFVGGFILISFVGLQQGILLTACINILAGLLLVLLEPLLSLKPRLTVAAASIAAALAGAFLVSPWDLAYLNSGVYVYAHDYNEVSDVRAVLKAYRPLYYREGPTATVAVIQSPRGTLSLTIDGKTDASTGRNADMSTQILLSHLPALFVDKPDDALMIGLGSGVSLGSLLQYKVKRADIVELSDAVIEASQFFQEYNHAPLQDPRVNLIRGDGRHHLKKTARQYDLIISQPSNPWITGVANLFTQEYYQLMSRRLNENGVACQWVPSYHMSKEMLGIILATFTDEFPYVSLWTSSVVGDLFLIGSNQELTLTYPLLLERFGRPGIRDDLRRIGMDDPVMLAKTFKFGREGIRTFLNEFGRDLPRNTDMNPIVEFASPRFLLTQRMARDFDSRTDLTGDLASLMNLLEFKDVRNRERFRENAERFAAHVDEGSIIQ